MEDVQSVELHVSAHVDGVDDVLTVSEVFQVDELGGLSVQGDELGEEEEGDGFGVVTVNDKVEDTSGGGLYPHTSVDCLTVVNTLLGPLQGNIEELTNSLPRREIISYLRHTL